MKPCPSHHHHEPEPSDYSDGEHYHVYPEWQEHDLSEECRCVTQRNWFQRYDGAWDYVIVHNEGH